MIGDNTRAQKWSAKVSKHSNALDLEAHVFERNDPHKIALSLKRSAKESHRRKGTPYQSAMSMLNFYINRAGKNLSPERKKYWSMPKRSLEKYLTEINTQRTALSESSPFKNINYFSEDFSSSFSNLLSWLICRFESNTEF